MQDYWHKQTKEKPLFPDLIWSRPEQKAHAGKLLIIGGNAHGFAAPALAYNEAENANIGISRVLLPDVLQKTVGKVLVAADFTHSTPSGSFSKIALASFLENGAWADAILLAGDFGRNSETAILLEKLTTSYRGLITITKDSVDYLIHNPETLLQRELTTIVLSFAQLQKMATNAHFEHAFTFSMDFIKIVELLHIFSSRYKAALITRHNDTIFVAFNGSVCSTKVSQEEKVWRVKTAAHAVVWELQNPSATFQALCSSILD